VGGSFGDRTALASSARTAEIRPMGDPIWARAWFQ